MSDIDFTVAGTQPYKMPLLYRQMLLLAANLAGANHDSMIMAHGAIRDDLEGKAVNNFLVMVEVSNTSVAIERLATKIRNGEEDGVRFRKPDKANVNIGPDGRTRMLKLSCYDQMVDLSYISRPLDLDSAARLTQIGLSSVAATADSLYLTPAFIRDHAMKKMTLLGNVNSKTREATCEKIRILTAAGSQYEGYRPLPESAFAHRPTETLKTVAAIIEAPR